MRAPLEKRRGGVFGATVFMVAGLAILIGLGIWQLDRKTWKENLIATINERLAGRRRICFRAKLVMDHRAAGHEYPPRVRSFPAEFLADQEALVYTAGSALRPDVKGPGYWVFAPARLAGGSIVVVNRGFVPSDRKDAASRAQGVPQRSIDIVGVMRWPEKPGLFTPAADPKDNVWYLRDPEAMAQAQKWGTAAPFYIDQESPVPAGGLPLPGKVVVNLPDNHLQYAITWFGLALALAGVYGVWLGRRVRARE